MYNTKEMLKQTPVQIAAAIVALLNLVIIFGVINMTGEQVAGVNTALVTILSLFVVKNTEPTKAVNQQIAQAVSEKEINIHRYLKGEQSTKMRTAVEKEQGRRPTHTPSR